MNADSPNIVIVAGPNGAGKSTAAPQLLRDYLGITEFVNADVIAQGLSAYNPEGAAMQAGRAMLARIRELSERRVSFAFETTLAAKSFAGLVRNCRKNGYQVNLIYLWIRTSDAAIERVAQRVRQGGHFVPSETIVRRFKRGLSNLFNTYMPIVDSWIVLDNSSRDGYQLIASQISGNSPQIHNEPLWNVLKESRNES
jgi:predicted ABC-type ATPase